MGQEYMPLDVTRLAAQMDAEIRALPVRNTPSVRAVRRRYSKTLKGAGAQFVLDLTGELVQQFGYRGPAYELIASHRGAFQSLDQAALEELGRGINSWWAVDSFARTLAGPAWRDGLVPDALIYRWARSQDRWWRRAALVCTVELNVRSRGGRGDVPRTLHVCCMLAEDHEDMVVKAMSWALRELVVHDAQAVRNFLDRHEPLLAARVKREVRSKLGTGLKNPRRTSR